MRIEACAYTHVGLNRDNNEDNYYLCGKYRTDTDKTIDWNTWQGSADHALFAVCDGMGGVEYGELASLAAVSALKPLEGMPFSEAAMQNVSRTNASVCAAKEAVGSSRAGTTLAALSIENGQAMAYGVGDSRVYLLRDDRFVQLTVDHTVVQCLVEMGCLTQEEAKTHPDRNKITQYIGNDDKFIVFEPSFSETLTLQDGDIFLLCSDGLTDMVEDACLKNLLQTELQPETQCGRLIQAALENGGRDNTTVMVVRITA